MRIYLLAVGEMKCECFDGFVDGILVVDERIGCLGKDGQARLGGRVAYGSAKNIDGR